MARVRKRKSAVVEPPKTRRRRSHKAPVKKTVAPMLRGGTIDEESGLPIPPLTLHDKDRNTWFGPKPEEYWDAKENGQYFYCDLVLSGASMSYRKGMEEECADLGIPIQVYTWPSGALSYRVDRKYAHLLPSRSTNKWEDIPYGFPMGKGVKPWRLAYLCGFNELMDKEWVVLSASQDKPARRRRRRKG